VIRLMCLITAGEAAGGWVCDAGPCGAPSLSRVTWRERAGSRCTSCRTSCMPHTCTAAGTEGEEEMGGGNEVPAGNMMRVPCPSMSPAAPPPPS